MIEPKTISVQELLSMGIGFERAKIIQMLADQDNEDDGKGKNFELYTSTGHYVVTKEVIKAYFLEHPKPTPRMNVAQELEYLRKKVAEYEATKPELPTEATPEDVQADIPSQKVESEKKQSIADIQKDLLQELKKKRGPKPKAIASSKAKEKYVPPTPDEESL